MLKKLKSQIRCCQICSESLPLGANPVFSASQKSKIVIIGQAPGTKVHKTGIPWNDPSGDLLRMWLEVDKTQFYNEDLFAIVPMGFCYPGKGKSGDLPPRPECAPQWHGLLWRQMPKIQLTLLIGQYAQKYYLQNEFKKNLTETVKSYQEYLPKYIVLPHPSPRNRLWLKKNPWFDEQVLPILKNRVHEVIA